jgi:hypothetical protein
MKLSLKYADGIKWFKMNLISNKHPEQPEFDKLKHDIYMKAEKGQASLPKITFELIQ